MFDFDPNDDTEDNKRISISFFEKPKGINFGFKMQITDNITSKKAIFYVKKYHLASRKDHLFDYVFYSKYFKPVRYSSGYLDEYLSSAPTPRNERILQLDLKEPFIYRLSELLNFTPEVHFFINPYVRDGFYIATKDLAQNNYLFYEFSDICNIYKKFKETLLANIKSNQLFIQSLMLLAFYSTILLINDLHMENFGFVLKVNDLNTTDPNNTSPTDIKSVDIESLSIESLKFIDFSPPKSQSYHINFKCCLEQNQYILGQQYGLMPKQDIRAFDENGNEMINTLIFKDKDKKEKYLFFSEVLILFQNRLNMVQLTPTKSEKEYIKHDVDDSKDISKLKRIINYIIDEINNLMAQKRGVENKPEEIILRNPKTWAPRSNAELLGLDNLDEAIADLKNYANAIIDNFKSAQEYINSKIRNS